MVPPSELANADRQSASADLMGKLSVVVEETDGHAPQRLEIPVYALGDGPDAASVLAQPVVPHEVLEDLERRGHEVRRVQRFVPVDLQDGRRVVVPVEQVQIVPVSRRPFQ